MPPPFLYWMLILGQFRAIVILSQVVFVKIPKGMISLNEPLVPRFGTDAQAAMALTSHLMHKHYCENDVEGILAWFDDLFLWFGAGEGEYAAGTEAVKAIFRQFVGKVPRCNISGEHYDAITIAPGVFLCTGRLWIATDPSTNVYLRVHQRVAMAYRAVEGELRCCHIHISNPYAEMMERVRAVPPGSGGLVVLPYFAGERCPVNDEKARGVIFGLTLEHTREHIYHAALEGIGFSVAQNIAVMEEIGLPVDMVTVVGGGTKNPVWMQIVADILGKPLSIPKVSIGASYGCALLAALGTGALHSFDELASVIKPGRVLQPDAQRHSQYQKIRHVYDSLYPATCGLMHEL